MRKARKRLSRAQAGFSLVELMIATMVLTIGLLALSGLLGIAILSNNRNKVDSTATMLAQSVVEHVNAALSSSSTTHLTDCMGDSVPVTAGGGGSALNGDGNIDYTVAADPNYSMMFVVCSTDPTTKQVLMSAYDLRWNVTELGGTQTYVITAAAVLAGTPTPNRDLRAFAFPSNLHVMVGPEPSPTGPGAAE